MGQYINFSTISLVSKKRRLIHMCRLARAFAAHKQSMDVVEGAQSMQLSVRCQF